MINISKRHTLVVLVATGFAINFAIHQNLEETLRTSSWAKRYIPKTSGTVLNLCFMLGWAVAPVLGAFLVIKYPANRVFGIAIGAVALFNLVVPLSIQYNSTLLAYGHLLHGIVMGVIFQANIVLWSHWAPLVERTQLVTLSLAGCSFGSALGYVLTGLLAPWLGSGFSFYFFALLGLLWCGLWWWASFERPAVHPTISSEERCFIQSSLGTLESNSNALITCTTTPWRCILTSGPMFGLVIATVANLTTHSLLILSADFYRQVHHHDLQEWKHLSGPVLYVVCGVLLPFLGWIADQVATRRLVSLSTTRKLFACTGLGLEAIFLTAMSLTHNTTYSLIAFYLVHVSGTFVSSALVVNHLDIGERFAPILMGITGLMKPITALAVAIWLEWTSPKNPHQWKVLFTLTAAVPLIGCILYCKFASGKRQDWAKPKEPTRVRLEDM